MILLRVSLPSDALSVYALARPDRLKKTGQVLFFVLPSPSFLNERLGERDSVGISRAARQEARGSEEISHLILTLFSTRFHFLCLIKPAVLVFLRPNLFVVELLL